MPQPKNKKRLLRALAGEPLNRPPVWLMRQAGRYLPEYRELRIREPDFLRFCYSPELTVEATLQPLRRYPLDAAILFADILLVPDALGQGVRFEEGEGPILDAIGETAEIAALDTKRIDAHLAPVFETVDRLSQALDDDTALIGFAGAPWTVAVYMIEGRGGTDHGTIKGWAGNRPEDLGALMDVLVEATAHYLHRQIESGAETVQLFDSWAGAVADDPAAFERWIIQPTKRLVDTLRERHPAVPVIGFPRGAGPLVEAYVTGTGVDAVGLDETAPLEWIAATLQPRCTVQGNLDNRILVRGGDALDRGADAILGALGGGPFIFNLGHGIVPETPPGNVARLCERVVAWTGSTEPVR